MLWEHAKSTTQSTAQTIASLWVTRPQKPAGWACSFSQEEFLRALEALQPDLCITAAYGCILPQRFLSIPPLGTINIHPSLLPKCVARASRAWS